MRKITVLSIAGATVALAAPAVAGPARTYTGRATAYDGRFMYGKVTVKTNGTKVTRVEIQSVTTSGCGGFVTLVFAPGTPGLQITKGSATIKGGRFSVRYRPDRTVPTQETEMSARITGRAVSGGLFRSGGLSTPDPSDGFCTNRGRFSARR